jgi:hypothetical protein
VGALLVGIHRVEAGGHESPRAEVSAPSGGALYVGFSRLNHLGLALVILIVLVLVGAPLVGLN